MRRASRFTGAPFSSPAGGHSHMPPRVPKDEEGVPVHRGALFIACRRTFAHAAATAQIVTMIRPLACLALGALALAVCTAPPPPADPAAAAAETQPAATPAPLPDIVR